MGLTRWKARHGRTRLAMSTLRLSSTCTTPGHERIVINKNADQRVRSAGPTEVTSDCRYVEDNYATKRRRKTCDGRLPPPPGGSTSVR